MTGQPGVLEIVQDSVQKILDLPFKLLPLYVNHGNPTFSCVSKERLKGNLELVDLVGVVDGEIHGVHSHEIPGVYALFQRRLNL